MYTSLSIQDFRGIHTLEMNDLRRVNILTGKNNCGKTSVLEAVYLLSRSDHPGSLAHLGAYRRFDTLDDNYWRAFFFNFGSQLTIAGRQGKVEKTLAIVPWYTADAYSIAIPEEWQQTILHAEIDPGHILGVSAVLTYQQGENGVPLEIRFSIGRKIDKPKELDIQLEEKGSIPPILTTFLVHPAYLVNASQRFGALEVRKELSLLIRSLQVIEPAIQYIRVIDETFYCDVGKERLLPLNVMGDGMVRLFSIILAIATTPGGVVLIDEIDTGFHYSSLEVMWKAVYEAAEQFDVQIFATTHSYECLRALGVVLQQRPESDDFACLYRIDKRQDAHDAVRFDQQQLKTSLEHFWEVR